VRIDPPRLRSLSSLPGRTCNAPTGSSGNGWWNSTGPPTTAADLRELEEKYPAAASRIYVAVESISIGARRSSNRAAMRSVVVCASR